MKELCLRLILAFAVVSSPAALAEQYGRGTPNMEELFRTQKNVTANHATVDVYGRASTPAAIPSAKGSPVHTAGTTTAVYGRAGWQTAPAEHIQLTGKPGNSEVN